LALGVWAALVFCLGTAAATDVAPNTATNTASSTPSSVYLEDLTSPQVKQLVAAGTTTVLVPIGGTEQNGPYMVLGKHNERARILAGRIAEKAGHALVAPVIAYVPEGRIDPPAAHMRFAGTLSISTPVFEGLLEDTARSLRQHGFREIFFLGDHGGYQRSEERVADRLNKEWGDQARCHVHALSAYYRVTQTDYVAALKQRGFGAAEIGTHAGLADTALSLAVDPALVRIQALQHAPRPGADEGVYGDPRRATAELGRIGADMIVNASAAAIVETRQHDAP
jgi:creatinine amidohydrolase/Fe(II)-dependent formamide hydrolase-like protein